MAILGSIIRYSYSLTKKNCFTVMVVVGIGFIGQGVQSTDDVQRFEERIYASTVVISLGPTRHSALRVSLKP